VLRGHQGAVPLELTRTAESGEIPDLADQTDGVDDVVREGILFDVVLKPNAGEMAGHSGRPKGLVCEQPLAAAREAAMHWTALVALKGARTHIAQPDGRAWRFSRAGPAASWRADCPCRPVPGAGPCTPARVPRWHGAVGYLARELAGEVPALVHRLDRQTRAWWRLSLAIGASTTFGPLAKPSQPFNC